MNKFYYKGYPINVARLEKRDFFSVVFRRCDCFRLEMFQLRYFSTLFYNENFFHFLGGKKSALYIRCRRSLRASTRLVAAPQHEQFQSRITLKQDFNNIQIQHI